MVQDTVKIEENREIARDYYELVLSTPELAKTDILPGQFLTIRISESPSPLLRRPFAFSGQEGTTCSMIYQRRGPGTDVLAGKRPGDRIDIIAPLGNSWPEPEKGETAILVAGGIGMGPILYFARKLKQKDLPFSLILGSRSSEFLPSADFTEGLNPVITTDDGTSGIKGTVSEALATGEYTAPRFYACGPHPMMKAVHEYAVKLNAPCHVSMEQTIACGVGACMGCVIQLTGTDRFARVCADGPIFDSREIVWT